MSERFYIDDSGPYKAPNWPEHLTDAEARDKPKRVNKKVRTSVIHDQDEQSIVFIPSGKRPLCAYCGAYFDPKPEEIAAATKPEGMFCMDVHYRWWIRDVGHLSPRDRALFLNAMREKGKFCDEYYLPVMEIIPDAETAPQEQPEPVLEPVPSPTDNPVL